MSIAIVCMVNNTAINLQSKPTNQSISIHNDTYLPSVVPTKVVDECPNAVSHDKKIRYEF